MSENFVVEVRVIGKVNEEDMKKLWNPNMESEGESTFLKQFLKGEGVEIARKEKVAGDWNSVEVLRNSALWSRLEIKVCR